MTLKTRSISIVSSFQSLKHNCIIILTSFLLTTVTFAQIPDLEWANSFGGLDGADGRSITVDANGNVFTTGFFSGTVDFDPGIGVTNLTSNGNNDFFVQKVDFSGNFLWAKSVGGLENDLAQSLTTDASGNVYVAGHFAGMADFDPGIGVVNLTSNGNNDVFIQKLDGDGNFLWVKSIGGANTEYCNGIASDASGNIYTTGSFRETVDFDPGLGIFNLVSNGIYDVFIQKLDANGNFLWAKSVGANGNESGNSITTDANGNVYTTGNFDFTVDFDPGAGITNLTSNWGADIFVHKMDANGNFLWAKSMGGSGNDFGHSVSIDINGDVYTTGQFQNTVDFDPGIGTMDLSIVNGYVDMFIQKLDGNGNFLWAKAIGGTGIDIGYSNVTDADGNVYTSGYFSGTVDFDPGNGISNVTSTNANADIFIQKLDGSGNFLWAIGQGGVGSDVARGVTADAYGNVHLTGVFANTVDFDPGAGTHNLTASAINGSRDVFIQKLASGSCQPNTSMRCPNGM